MPLNRTSTFQRALGLGALLLLFTGAGATRPPVCELAAHPRAVDLGIPCGVLVDGRARPDGSDPMECIRHALETCTPAYVHGIHGFPNRETHDAILVRRNVDGCLVVASRNSLPALEAEKRALVYKKCRAIAKDSGGRPYELGIGCGAEITVEVCPPLLGNHCVAVAGDDERAACGSVVEIGPRYGAVNADDFLSPPGPLRLEPGYGDVLEELDVEVAGE